MIIGLSGKKRSGKDTCAQALIKNGFQKLAFAEPLKTICARVTELPFETFDSDQFKEKNFDQPMKLGKTMIIDLIIELGTLRTVSVHQGQELMKKGLDKVFETPRAMLEYVGTDLVRDLLGENFWTRVMVDRINMYQNVVVTDCRFENERILLKGLGGTLVLINRDYKDLNPSTARSETSLGELDEYDYILYNNNTVAELHASIIKCTKGII